MKAIFDSKPTSIYDDEVTSHYQFPSDYDHLVEACIGDRVIFRQPREGGGDMAYFASAIVSEIVPGAPGSNGSYAHLTDFMQFGRRVPWRLNGRYWEERLRVVPTPMVGVTIHGKSVREISEEDFAAIIAAGLEHALDPENAERLQVPPAIAAQAGADLVAPPAGEREQRTEQVLTNRTIRDANFRDLICKAYGGRCAVTRLHMIDGSNNPEVQAAHIWAVADRGPDVVQNGIALSGTVHWLFDRHLITIGDDYRLIVADDKIPEELRGLSVRNGTELHLPDKTSERPHPDYLARHRAKFDAKNRR